MPADAATVPRLSRGQRRCLAFVAGGTALALGLLTAAVLARTAVVIRPDHAVTGSAMSVVHHHHAVLDFFRVVTRIGDPRTVDIVCAVWVLAALWRRQYLLGIAVLAARLIALGAEQLLKAGVDRPRPHVLAPVAHAAGPSFPSGHSTGTTTLAALAVVLVWTGHAARLRWTVTALLTVVTIMVAASRVMLGVHYLSDVAAGACLGVAIASGAVLARGLLQHR